MTDSTWLVPAGARAATIQALRAVLGDHHFEHQVLETVPDPALGSATPLATIIAGGKISPPMLDALRFCAERGIPALVFVEEFDERSEAMLLTMGAFDVVGVPAHSTRINSRVVALHRNVAMLSGSSATLPRRGDIKAGELTIDLGRRQVLVGNEPIQLTKTEFNLLATLARDPERVYSRAELRIINGDARATGSLESHLSRTRRKVREAGGGHVIEVVRGVGYRLGDVVTLSSASNGS